jgi:hypothetical protein
MFITHTPTNFIRVMKYKKTGLVIGVCVARMWNMRNSCKVLGEERKEKTTADLRVRGGGVDIIIEVF